MIGSRIRQRRLELNLTQVQLAMLTGIKKNTISNYENNISSPNEENILKLMKALKCDANYIFEWTENEDISLSLSEKNHIKKYRTLDEHGKKAVDNILDIEYERYLSIVENNSDPEIQNKTNKSGKTVKVFKAARSTDGEKAGYVELSEEILERLKKAPPTDDKF